MKISDLYEAIKGWKHAGRDINKWRAEKAAAARPAKLVRLKKDGTESGMHDAASTFDSEEAARQQHERMVGYNPGKRIRHNLYVDGQLVQELDGKLEEVSHKVGMAASRTLAKSDTITPEQQQKYIQQYQKLHAKELELQAKPDASTGTYAKQLMHLSRQKTKVAKQGHLDAFGKPLKESASGGAAGAGSVATSVNPFGIVMRRPSLFGYTVPKKQTKSHKKHKRSK